MATSTRTTNKQTARPPAKKTAPAKQTEPVKEQAAKAPAKKAEAVPYTGGNVQPRAESQVKMMADESWQRIATALGEGWYVAWSRPKYGMFKQNVRGPWATVCIHGTVRRDSTSRGPSAVQTDEYPVTKGAEAETAGRHRDAWCSRCKAEAEAPAEKAPAKKAAPAEKVQAPKPGPAAAKRSA